MPYERLQANQAIFRVGPDLIEDRLDAMFFQPKYAKFDIAISRLPFEVVEIGSAKASKLFTHMPGFSKDKWVEYVPEGIPYLLQNNVQEGYIDPEGWEHITPLAHANLKTSSLKQGDVLLTATGMHYGKAAVVPEWLQTANACPDILRIVLQDRINPYYVAAYLNSEYGQIELRRHSSGANRPRIITEYARKVRLVLPDRPIQDIIGLKVWLVERCRQRARELLEEAKEIFAHEIGWPIPLNNGLGAFIDPIDVTHRLDAKYYRKPFLELFHWLENYREGVVPLESLVESVANGIEYRQFVPEGKPYLTVGDISNGRLNTNTAPRIPSDAPITEKGIVSIHDVLVVRTGSIGQASFIEPKDAGCVISSHFIRLRLEDLSEGPWISYYINSEVGSLLQQRIAYGAVQPQIGQDDLLDLPVPRFPQEVKAKISDNVFASNSLLWRAEQLIEDSKADVKGLIEGRLDMSFSSRQNLEATFLSDYADLADELHLALPDLFTRYYANPEGSEEISYGQH